MNVCVDAEYIVRCAAERDVRCVLLGPLVFFSTSTGDAWMLDPEDGFARRLARGGQPLPNGIFETEQRFAIDWNGHFEFQGGTLLLTENDSGRTVALYGDEAEMVRRQIELGEG
jgi:hypothetical protein